MTIRFPDRGRYRDSLEKPGESGSVPLEDQRGRADFEGGFILTSVLASVTFHCKSDTG
jgi:hypothetical protein